MDTKLKGFYFRSGLFSILSLLGAVFNYALYPVLVRILDAPNFGDFAVIIAISNQIFGLMIAFNVISIYLVKSRDEAKAKRQAETVQKRLIWLFIFVTLTVGVLSPFIKQLLHIQNVGMLLLLSLFLIAGVPVIIWTGYLQGHKELVRVGFYNLSSSFSKLVLAILLALLLGTVGAVLGMLGGIFVGLIIIALYPGVKLPNLKTVFQKSSTVEVSEFKHLRSYILYCILVVGAFSFLQNYDITLAKALFIPATAGLYSGISILSNALYYVPVSSARRCFRRPRPAGA